MKPIYLSRIAAAFAAFLCVTASTAFADSLGEPGRDAGGNNPLKNVYFGEQHMHTRNSFDAFTIGVRPNKRAAYYVRVLEIPTPRWSTYDSVRNNLPLTDIVAPTIQERAWSSPIWYTPASGN